MRILLHHPNGSDGTSFYRAYGPFSALQREYPEIHITNSNDHDIHWGFLRQFDVVFMQRPASKYQLNFVTMAKDYGIPVWVDWDDHYLDIPDTNPRKHLYTPYHIDQLREIAKLADVITVSTEFLKEEFSKYNANVRVIRNAHDTDLLSPEYSSPRSSSKLILWRGSDTHGEDLDYYKAEILELMDETPDYVWGFFGYYPEWAVDHLPSHRIRLYGYDGVVEYIKRMTLLTPEMVYVPLVDSPFNRSRSSIGWIEATYAGAVTLMPHWPEWKDLPGVHYTGKENFKSMFRVALALGNDNVFKDQALLHWSNYYTLPKVNEERMQILRELTSKKSSFQQFIPNQLPAPFSDKEFFDYNRSHGWTQENEGWVKGQERTATFLIEHLRAKSVLDVGCGTGALLEVLIKKGLAAMGIDSNPYNKEFFVKRNPLEGKRFILDQAQNVTPGDRFDVVVCIEVFEHLPDEVCQQILFNLWEKCTWFVFTSTPYHSTPHFDRQWGHINVKPTPHWIKFFEDRGFKLVQRLDYPAKWALLFVSTAPSA